MKTIILLIIWLNIIMCSTSHAIPMFKNILKYKQDNNQMISLEEAEIYGSCIFYDDNIDIFIDLPIKVLNIILQLELMDEEHTSIEKKIILNEVIQSINKEIESNEKKLNYYNTPFDIIKNYKYNTKLKIWKEIILYSEIEIIEHPENIINVLNKNIKNIIINYICYDLDYKY